MEGFRVVFDELVLEGSRGLPKKMALMNPILPPTKLWGAFFASIFEHRREIMRNLGITFEELDKIVKSLASKAQGVGLAVGREYGTPLFYGLFENRLKKSRDLEEIISRAKIALSTPPRSEVQKRIFAELRRMPQERAEGKQFLAKMGSEYLDDKIGKGAPVSLMNPVFDNGYYYFEILHLRNVRIYYAFSELTPLEKQVVNHALETLKITPYLWGRVKSVEEVPIEQFQAPIASGDYDMNTMIAAPIDRAPTNALPLYSKSVLVPTRKLMRIYTQGGELLGKTYSHDAVIGWAGHGKYYTMREDKEGRFVYLDVGLYYPHELEFQGPAFIDPQGVKVPLIRVGEKATGVGAQFSEEQVKIVFAGESIGLVGAAGIGLAVSVYYSRHPELLDELKDTKDIYMNILNAPSLSEFSDVLIYQSRDVVVLEAPEPIKNLKETINRLQEFLCSRKRCQFNFARLIGSTVENRTDQFTNARVELSKLAHPEWLNAVINIGESAYHSVAKAIPILMMNGAPISLDEYFLVLEVMKNAYDTISEGHADFTIVTQPLVVATAILMRMKAGFRKERSFYNIITGSNIDVHTLYSKSGGVFLVAHLNPAMLVYLNQKLEELNLPYQFWTSLLKCASRIKSDKNANGLLSFAQMGNKIANKDYKWFYQLVRYLFMNCSAQPPKSKSKQGKQKKSKTANPSSRGRKRRASTTKEGGLISWLKKG